MTSSFRRGMSIVAASCAALCITASPAHAHDTPTVFGTFCDGVAHVVITPADLLVVIGLGLLAGMQGAAVSRAMSIALPAAWLVGSVAGSFFPDAGDLPWATTISFGIVGVLVALNAKLSRPIAIGLGCVAGALHGYVSGATLAPGAVDWLSLAGAVLATFAIVALAAVLVVNLRASWTRIAVRVAGSWMVAIALLMIGWLARGEG